VLKWSWARQFTVTGVIFDCNAVDCAVLLFDFDLRFLLLTCLCCLSVQ
jgi:hypothetical protein